MEYEDGEAPVDEVVARIFRSQRDKRVEHQIGLVQLALADIRRDILNLREVIVSASM